MLPEQGLTACIWKKLDSMVFVGPFQLRRFCDSENKCEDVFSKKHL